MVKTCMIPLPLVNLVTPKIVHRSVEPPVGPALKQLECLMNKFTYTLLFPVAHRSRNTWSGGVGWTYPLVLLKNGFLTKCLLFGNTKVCCYN